MALWHLNLDKFQLSHVVTHLHHNVNTKDLERLLL